MNALLATLSCVYSEIVFTIISFFQKLIKGRGVRIRAGGGLENFSKNNKRGGDDYSVLESSSTIKVDLHLRLLTAENFRITKKLEVVIYQLK